MEVTILDKVETDDSLQALEDFEAHWMNYFHGMHQVRDDNKQMRRLLVEQNEKIKKLEEALEQNEKIKKLEEALEQRKKEDEWSSRVTYEGVVEQIAACEDAKERDEARKLIEPLLKKAQVTQFRRDIKKRVKELNEDSAGGVNFNNYGTYTEVHSGGININNKKDAGH